MVSAALRGGCFCVSAPRPCAWFQKPSCLRKRHCAPRDKVRETPHRSAENRTKWLCTNLFAKRTNAKNANKSSYGFSSSVSHSAATFPAGEGKRSRTVWRETAQNGYAQPRRGRRPDVPRSATHNAGIHKFVCDGASSPVTLRVPPSPPWGEIPVIHSFYNRRSGL